MWQEGGISIFDWLADFSQACGGLTELWSLLCAVEDGEADNLITAHLLWPHIPTYISTSLSRHDADIDIPWICRGHVLKISNSDT